MLDINPVQYFVRKAKPNEFVKLGQIMVRTYTRLDGFPKAVEIPAYYKVLENIGDFANKPGAELLIATSGDGEIAGGVVYFSNMQYYGAKGIFTEAQNASGFRLLAVDSSARGQGVGKLLSQACIQKARDMQHDQVIIHSTKAMQVAWSMYKKLGFTRVKDFDFNYSGIDVFGFHLLLDKG